MSRSGPVSVRDAHPQVQTSLPVRVRRILRTLTVGARRADPSGHEGEAERVPEDRAAAVADERRGIVAERRRHHHAEPHRSEHRERLAVLRVQPVPRDRRDDEEERAADHGDPGQRMDLERGLEDPVHVRHRRQ